MFEEYLTTLSKSNQNYTRIAMRKYCNYRGITVEEVTANPEREKEHIMPFIKSNFQGNKRNTLETKAHYVRKYLKSLGVVFKKTVKKDKYFTDEKMKQFLIFVGFEEKTKKRIAFMIRKFCRFVNKTPSQLIDEAQDQTKQEIELMVMEFYNKLLQDKLNTSWKTVKAVMRFYKRMCDIDLYIKRKDRKKRKLMSNNNKTLIDKKIMLDLLHVAPDFRDSAILCLMWESGTNPVDICSLQYSDVKEFLNLKNPDAIKEAETFLYERSKNNVDFIFCLGVNTLRHLSKMINVKMKNNEVNLNEDFTLFTNKQIPYTRMTPENIYNIVRRISKKAGYKLAPNEFRKSFNTRTKSMLKHFDKEIFMGHVGGIERHYDISEIGYFTKEYRKAWEILFDLTFDNERLQELENYYEMKTKQLEEENRQLREEFNELRQFSKQESPESILLNSIKELPKEELVKILEKAM